ncbi:tyrosine-type recombinase/integrase [Paraburkholderia heleia]|uniref:tyrosine-type recombinase/integrase n=1 Tax=Paraburkholderia heleia TaxID=634127 RepID=UPI0031D18895
MKQAKTFTEKELKQVLTYVSLRRHALRNRVIVLLTHWAGMRVGEVAALLVGDVLDTDRSIKSEIRLAQEQTKGRHARTVFLGQKLRRELAAYVSSLKNPKLDGPLFYTQKRAGFTANTLCQYFHWLYKEAGIQGASSHSGRRSFITNLANKGVGVRVLMSLAGHRDISTTQRYIDVNDDMQRKAVDLV